MKSVTAFAACIILASMGCSDDNITKVNDTPQDTLATLSVCNPDEPQQNLDSCIPEDKSIQYAELWKQELLSRNTISEGYFDTHISSIRTASTCWNNGITFEVRYRITIDWAVIDREDEFMVMLSSSTGAYQYLDIPRDVFLDGVQIGVILDNNVFGSSVGPVEPLERLPFDSCRDAILAFQDSTGSEVILPTRIDYYVPGKIPREDGYPYFIGRGIIDLSENECIEGYFNLFNGDSDAWLTACIIE